MLNRKSISFEDMLAGHKLKSPVYSPAPTPIDVALDAVMRIVSRRSLQLDELISRIYSDSRSAGYEVSSMEKVEYMGGITSPDRVALKLKFYNFKEGHTNATVEVQFKGGEEEPRIHAVSGIPGPVLAKLHDLLPSSPEEENSEGAQALGEDDPDPARGGGSVASESSAGRVEGVELVPVEKLTAAAAAAVAMIDLATVKAELSARQETRRYVGASSIGSKCHALLALSLRGFPGDMPDAQLLRIFNDGHEVERKVVAALKAAGYDVSEVDPSTGKQYVYTSHGGHHRANLDGLIREKTVTNETMTLEVKSMNRAMFDKFKRRGVKLSHPEYFDQVQDGLMLARSSGEKFDKCFLIAYCKDNSQYHVEIVKFDEEHAAQLRVKVGAVITHGFSERIAKHKNEYECKQCFKRTSCWEPNVQDRHCWHCEYAQPDTSTDDKSWTCSISGGKAVAVCSSFSLFRPKKAP